MADGKSDSRVDRVLRTAAARYEPALTRLLRRVLSPIGIERYAQALAEAASEGVAFVVKLAWACLFGGLMIVGLVVTILVWPEGAALARYDALFLYALAIQGSFLATRLERPREALVILVFHVVGTAMEVFKTHVGSWHYPGEGALFIGGVPLFSGFMYAAVGSYLARVWRTTGFSFDRHPPLGAVALLGVAIYANFFTHHFVPDVRLALFAASVLLFGRTMLHFTVLRRRLRMPLLIGLVLTSGVIYVAENVGTLTMTWTYPDQTAGWRPVSLSKWGSWYLLIILSYALVAVLHLPRARRTQRVAQKA